MIDKARNGTVHRASSALPGGATSGAFHLSLLGPFSLTGPSGEAIEIGSKKNRVLLAMLASAPSRSMSRDALAGVLWAEHSEEQARNSLRQAIAVLRKELNGHDTNFFAEPSSAVALRSGQISFDTDTFLSDIKVGTAKSLERAISRWRGSFLADVIVSETELEHWLTEQREHYNSHYISAMDRLVPLLNGPARIDMARRLVQADNLRETSHRHLMEAYYAAGERSQALRHYDKVRKLLHEELGVEPSLEIEDLRKEIASNVHNSHNGHGTKAVSVSARPAPVPPSPAAVQAPPPPDTAPIQPATRANSSSTLAYTGAVIAALVTVAAAGWFFTRATPEPVTKPSVAILPFESLSGNVEDARIATGLTIDTITDLSRYSDFRVMAKDTTDAYKGKAVDIRALGKDLKVSHVLKGTFQRNEDHLRITAQLIDASTGETLWSDRYDRLIGEIFAVQSDVADHIANSLGGREGKVGKSLTAGARRKPPADLGVYELYLLAQETMYSDLSAEHMKEAQKILNRAIAKDPAFARAYVRYANTYAWLATYESGASDLFKQMLSYARKAVSLDPMDADAHAALGYALTLTGDMQQGEAHLDEALRLTPNAFDILIFHACLNHAYGNAGKGAEAAERAIAINPGYPKWAVPCLRLALVLVGRYDDAIRIQLSQPEDEWNTDGFVIMAGSLASLGKKEEAAALAKRGVAKFPGLLSIERFALNRSWAPGASKVMEDLMRGAGFPVCANSQDLADTPQPVRLPECTG
jgi:TolB-like protein/DNA-binding SARP family transcriptional activator